MKVFLDIAKGDSIIQARNLAAFQTVSNWLSAQHASYGLPSTLTELDDVQKETLQSVYEGSNVSEGGSSKSPRIRALGKPLMKTRIG